jgi:3-hydroxyacyl-[acyl-carrier-protein] dehydratase
MPPAGSLAAGALGAQTMRFSLIDRIVSLEPGARLEAVKSLTMAEEYLADHFPAAPVMPGVLMLEALVEASAWLIRASEDFSHGVVVLQEARAVKYASFVEPGNTLRITTEILSQDERFTKLKAQGTVDESVAVAARLVMERFDPEGDGPAALAANEYLKQRMREWLGVLNHAT